MFFAVITLFPEMFEAITAYGISGRAAKSDLVQVTCINPRDYALPKTGGIALAMNAAHGIQIIYDISTT